MRLIASCAAAVTLAAALANPGAQAQKSTPKAPPASAISTGKKVYAAQGCNACHTIAGQGGKIGPDLSNAGGLHAQKWLEEHVVNPKKHNPNSTMPAYGGKIKPADLAALGTYLASLKAGAPAGPRPAAVPKADPQAVARVEKTGAAVREIAQNDNRLEVDYHLQGTAITDASLAPLKGLKHVVELHLGRTSVTDAGLAAIKGMTDLEVLHLENTKITDAGLAHLKGLKKLTYLNLYGTAVTDAGLEHLKDLTNLRSLYLWQTKVTSAGVERLKQALPKVSVVLGYDQDAQAKQAGK